jgi:hypothetical protein
MAMKDQVINKKDLKHANFHITAGQYKKLRFLAAERGVSLEKIYIMACTEFLDRNRIEVKSLQAKA